MPLSADTRRRAREIIARYPKPRSALLPMLHLVQAEEGYVSPAGIALCAEELGLTKAEVGAVATFYTMYKRHPTGDWLVSVCTNLSCQLLGGEEIFARLSRALGVGHNETTPDRRFTLEHAECLAACDYAPVVTVNYEFFDNQTLDSAEEIVAALARGDRPHPTRGEALQDFHAISMELAGFVDPRRTAESLTTRAPAHPEPPTPVDVRGRTDTDGTDVAVPAAAAEFGVPGGVTERVLRDDQAAATYGDAATADAGAVAPDAPRPATSVENGSTGTTPESAGSADVSATARGEGGRGPTTKKG